MLFVAYGQSVVPKVYNIFEVTEGYLWLETTTVPYS